MILSGNDIKLCLAQRRMKIAPISPDTIRENGVDLRIGRKVGYPKLKSFSNAVSLSLDVEGLYDIVEEESYIVLPPQTFCLAHTLETISLPTDLVGLCSLRSTWARMGLMIPPTIIDAGFEGQLVIEIVNMNPNTLKIPVNSRFLHVVFFETKSPCIPYRGKYYNQKGIVLPKEDEMDEARLF